MTERLPSWFAKALANKRTTTGEALALLEQQQVDLELRDGYLARAKHINLIDDEGRAFDIRDRCIGKLEGEAKLQERLTKAGVPLHYSSQLLEDFPIQQLLEELFQALIKGKNIVPLVDQDKEEGKQSAKELGKFYRRALSKGHKNEHIDIFLEKYI